MKNRILIIFLIFCSLGLAQEAAQDSIQQATTVPDTLTIPLELETPDSTIQSKQRQSDIDTTITYSALDIYSPIDEKKFIFTGNAEISYKKMTLKAGKITLDWEKHEMNAEPLADTTWVKTDPTGTDSTMKIEMKGYPTLVDGGTEMSGAQMIYNYETEKGRIIKGETELEGGKYIGMQIKRVDKNTFNISQSNYSACEIDTNQHYHFEAAKMKMIPNDKVIVKDVVAYIFNIPVAYLPFAVFPNKKGRQSGLIVPTYGQSDNEGRFLRGGGYYWAPNDYFDSRLLADFFEKSGWLFRSSTNYNVRYKMRGSISGSLTRKNFTDGDKQRRWDLQIRHSHTISPTSRFSVNGNFISDNSFYKSFSTNMNTRLTRVLRSNATYSKNWPKQKMSLSVNLSHQKDIQDDLTSVTLPQLTFRKSQTQIFKPKKDKSRKRGRTKKPEPKWYENFYMSYNSSLQNRENERLQWSSEDSADVKVKDITRNLSHNVSLSLNSPKKFFGWLDLNQSLNGKEEWYNEAYEFTYNPETEEIEKNKVNSFATQRNYSYSATANTKIYGMVTPDVFDIQAIRHVVTPSVSFSYRPEFTETFWGRYKEVTKPDGSKTLYDRFSGSERTRTTGSKRLTFSVRNLFQMKKGYGEKEKKLDLFSFNVNSGFNFQAEEYRLDQFRTSWRANPSKNFSLTASTTHDPYAWDNENKQRIHQYQFANGNWKSLDLFRTTNIRFSCSLRLQGKDNSKKKNEHDDDQTFEDELDDMTNLYEGDDEEMSVLEENLLRDRDRFQDERVFGALSIPWRANLNFNFSLDKSRDPDNPTKRYYVDITGAEVNLTPNWRISYSAQYDLDDLNVTHHRFNIFRNLHCWKATINWVPSGYAKSVYVRLQIKAPSLQDIKIEKRGGRRSALGY